MKEVENKTENGKYISLNEAAKIYGCTQKHLNLMARKKKLKATKIGRNWMTTLEWLKEYTQKIEILTQYTKTPTSARRILKLNSSIRSIVATSLSVIMLFTFFTSAYVATKNGVFETPKTIKNITSKFSVNNISKAFASVFNLPSVFDNLEKNESDDVIVDIAKTIIRGAKKVDQTSNKFFGGIFDSVFGFFDKIICGILFAKLFSSTITCSNTKCSYRRSSRL